MYILYIQERKGKDAVDLYLAYYLASDLTLTVWSHFNALYSSFVKFFVMAEFD